MRRGQSTSDSAAPTGWLSRNLWPVLGLAAVAVASVVMARQFLAYHRIVDLEVYRMGGRALLDGDLLYGVRYPTDNLPFTYPPFAALAFVPFALVPVAPAVVCWALVSMAALARICVLLMRAAPGARPRSWSLGQGALALFVVAFFFEPVLSTIAYGQVNLVIAWLVLEDVLRERPSKYGGVLLGLATGLKLTPGVFVVYLWCIGRRADAWRAALITALTMAVGFALQPGQAWDYWTGVAYDTSRVGVLGSVRNQSITGTVARLWTPGDHRVVSSALGVLVVALTIVLARRLFHLGEPLLAACVVATGGLLASPVSWTHHWLWLLVIAVALLPTALPTPNWCENPRMARTSAPIWARGLLVGVVVVAVQSIFGENASLVWRVGDPDMARGGPHGFEQIYGNGYVLVALAFLAYALLLALTRDRQPDDPAGTSADAASSARRTRR